MGHSDHRFSTDRLVIPLRLIVQQKRERWDHFKSDIPQQREFSTQQGADMGIFVDVLATPTAIRIPGAIQGVGGFLLQLTHRLNRKARQPA